MKISILFIIIRFITLAYACDESELADPTRYSSYFIYATENIDSFGGHNIERFDLKRFLNLLEFKNTSQTFPLTVHPKNSFLKYVRSVTCGKNSSFPLTTEMYTSPPNLTITGILYGCNLYFKAHFRFIIFDTTRWSEMEMQKQCQNFEGIPPKYLTKMDRCLQEFKDYLQKCTKITIEDNFPHFDLIFGVILLLIVILFVACIIHKYYKSSPLSNWLS